MLAEVFLRERYEQGYAIGFAKGFAEGKAEALAEARGRSETLSAVRQVAERRGWDPEDIQGLIDETREFLRNEDARTAGRRDRSATVQTRSAFR